MAILLKLGLKKSCIPVYIYIYIYSPDVAGTPFAKKIPNQLLLFSFFLSLTLHFGAT